MNLKLLRLEATRQSISDVQRILENSPRYCMNVSGEVAGVKDGQKVFESLPENFPRENKYVLGVYNNEVMVGIVDCLISFPIESKAHIGLLLIDENYQRQGFGKEAYLLLEEYIKGFGHISSIRLAVVRTNEIVMPFWEKLGFMATGEAKAYQNKSVRSESMVMEKSLGNISITEEWESFEFENILSLYESVGWSSYTGSPEDLRRAFQNSSFVLVATEGDSVVGGLRSLSDDVAMHYLQDILVKPSHQKKGIGRQLLKMALERYSHVRTHMLLTDDEDKQKIFYESNGYKNIRHPENNKLNTFIKFRS